MIQADLATLLKTVPPRERAGSQTSARYAFQANFGILRLVELRESGGDFRIVFDMFDDITVLDSADIPSQVRFYQLKSKDPGDWTMTQICEKSGARAPRSIVSRLYAHLVTFGAAVAETGMVTNAPYRLKLQDESTTSGAHHRIVGNELHADEVVKLTTAVTEDISSADISGWLPKLAFIRTTLGVHGQELVVLGRLQQHLEQTDGITGIKLSAIYETLHASIAHKTSFYEEGANHADTLIRKSLTRNDLEQLLSRAAGRQRSFIEDWEIIRSDLDRQSIGSVVQIRIKTAAIAYSRDRHSGRPNASRFAEFIAGWVRSNMMAIERCESISQITELMQAALPEQYGWSDLELRAALIVEAHEASNVTT